MLEMVGIASFICGFLIMFAIHRVVFDHYASAAEDYIEKLKKENKTKVEVEHIHTYATPDDVTNIEFWED